MSTDQPHQPHQPHQLPLFAGTPGPLFAPAPLLTPTRLLWEAAGRPTDTTDTPGHRDAVQVPGARCWWCAQPAPDGWARPVSCLADTFADRPNAALPSSPWLCLPCGWTLCDRVALPQAIGEAKIRARAARGGRLIVSLRGAPAARVLVLELHSGQVGLWRVTGNAASDADWLAAVERLRAAPEPLGEHDLLDVVSYSELSPEATEKFRSYHHFAHSSRWWPCTIADRQEIRAWLLSPPAPPWVGVIGDGQKHDAIEATRLDAITQPGDTLCTVLYRRAVVRYQPAALSRLVDAIEALIVAGANDDEIRSGQYAPRGVPLLLAVRAHEPVVQPWRGGAGLDLALYLRRPRAALTALESP